MTSSPRPGWPGWYLDPDQPTRLRYFDGASWTARHRVMPAWSRGGAEGLVVGRRGPGADVATLPRRLAAEDDPSLIEGPALLADLSVRAPVRHSQRLYDQGQVARRPSSTHRRRSRSYGLAARHREPSRPGRSPGRRWSALPAAVVAVLIVLVAAGLGYKVFEPALNRPQDLVGLSWIEAANSVCRQQLPALRQAEASAASITTTAQAGAAALRTANGFAAVAGHLGALYASPADRGAIQTWLNEWYRFDQLQRRYAAEVTQDPAGAAALAHQAGAVVVQANSFAEANDLGVCLLSPGPSFAELLGHPEVAESVRIGSRFGVMAFHGGLEEGTAEIARLVAEGTGASLYLVVQPSTLGWHVASSRVSPAVSPALADFLDHVDVSLAIHGYGRRARPLDLLLGGNNRTLAAHVAAHLRHRLTGFRLVEQLEAIPPEMRGIHPDNPVNRSRHGGVQLELPHLARGSSAWRSVTPSPPRAAPGLVEGLVGAIVSWPAQPTSKVPPARQ